MSNEDNKLSRRKLIGGVIGGLVVVGGAGAAGLAMGANSGSDDSARVSPSETPTPTPSETEEPINEIDIDPSKTPSKEPVKESKPDYAELDESYINEIDSEEKISQSQIEEETKEIENIEIPDDVVIKAPGE